MNELAVSLTRIADSVGDLLNSPIVIAAVALTGVILTARSSRKVAFSQNLHERLSTCYAELFSSYSLLITATPENKTALIAALMGACEKTMTLCSNESLSILNDLEDHILRDKIDTKRLGELFTRLRASARADLDGIIPREKNSFLKRQLLRLKNPKKNTNDQK